MKLTSLNKKLNFSWSHIIAFVALIAVSYFTFMGVVYATGGNFVAAAIGLAVVDFVLILTFIGAQQLKASGVKMRRKIVAERALVFASPVVFAIMMMPTFYFWQVESRHKQLVREFNASLSLAGELFNDYETYADRRINEYTARLDSIQRTLSGDAYVYGQLGFTAGEEEYQAENMVLTLRTQLFGERYGTLKAAAHKWIRDARAGASVWNVFIVGNLAEIRNAVQLWESQLQEIASEKMSNESGVPEFASESAGNAIDGIRSVSRQLSKAPSYPTPTGLAVGIVLYAMLLLPYIIQRRDGKSIYGLFHSNHRTDDWLSPQKTTGSDEFSTF